MNRKYDDGLDEEENAPPRRTAVTRIETAPEEPSEGLISRLVSSVQWITIPLFAALVFGICAMLAASTVGWAMRRFAEESGVNPLIFVAVPGLFAVMFALVVYQNADKRITRISQSISRGILVALLTWISFSALATWAWGPTDFLPYFSNVLLLSGIIGGGPMLAAALVAGWLVGWLIKQRKLGWIMTD
jgi:hypothetical protein